MMRVARGVAWVLSWAALAVVYLLAAAQAGPETALLWTASTALAAGGVAFCVWGARCNHAARTPPPLERTISARLRDGSRRTVRNPLPCCIPGRDPLDAGDALHAGKIAQVDARLAGEREQFPKLLSPDERLTRRTP